MPVWTNFYAISGFVFHGLRARITLVRRSATARRHGHGERAVGRTVLPFSQVLEQEAQEWRKFRRGLRKEDQQFLDRLFEEARLHVQAGVYASRPWPFETILISILLEHEKALAELRAKLKEIERKGEGG